MFRFRTQGEAPVDDELQRSRVSIFGLSVTLLAAPVFFLNLVTNVIGASTTSRWSLLVQAAGAFAAGFTWLWLRRNAATALLVSALDALTAIAGSMSFQLMAMEIPPPARPDLIATITTLLLMMARVVIVPSTPWRTLAISGTMMASLIGISFVTMGPYVDDPTSPLHRYRGEMTFWTVVWGVLGVALMVFASAVLFGLRREVQRAQRLGQYVLGDKLGEGGMGQVFTAQHALLRRPTALKILHAPPGDSGRALARFEREVQHTASLTHPNTITIYDYGQTPEGLFYYAMELLDGADLERIVAATGPMPPGRVVYVMRQVLAALAEAHARGLIHRDVKPSNIVLCSRGGLRDFVKVLDFGLVKNVRAARGGGALSAVDEVVGTPLYMPPEAMRSEGEIDGRGDLYALGCVAYFLLTGTPVFSGSTLFEIAAHHLKSLPERPSVRAGWAIPTDLEDLVLRCLAKEPDMRPRSALDLDVALGRCASAGDWSAGHAAAWWDECGAQLERQRAEMRRNAEDAGAVTQVDARPAPIAARGQTVVIGRRRRSGKAGAGKSGRRSGSRPPRRLA